MAAYNDQMSTSNPGDRLDSWKAIARHINRSERTARRWEADEGMPVHRHRHQSQATVYAYTRELDAWLTAWESGGSAAASTPQFDKDDEQCSIAVLPFEFVGANVEQAYIADGFTDEVIADLAKIASLRVISRTSTMQLKGSSLTIGEIASRLDVEFLLEGSVRCHADAIRASVRLIEPDRERHIWSEKYAGHVHDVFEIQERIARDTAAAMRLRLTTEDDSRLARRSVTNWSAWLAAVQARSDSWRWTREGIDHAQSVIEQELATTGDDAYLLVTLGKNYLHRREAGLDANGRALEQAQACVDRAVAADPDGAAVFELRGWLHYSSGEIQLAVDNLKAALARQGANPDTLGLLCNCYLISGQLPVARSLIPQVLAIDPLSPIFQILPSWADVLEGRHRDAVEPYRNLLAQEPQSPIARMFLVWILAINDQRDEIQTVVQGFGDRDSGSIAAQVARCFAAAVSGTRPQVEFTAESQALARSNDMYPRMFAQAFALADEPEAAMEWLSLAVARGFINYPYLHQHDPLLTRLNKYPSYRNLLKEVKQEWSGFRV